MNQKIAKKLIAFVVCLLPLAIHAQHSSKSIKKTASIKDCVSPGKFEIVSNGSGNLEISWDLDFEYTDYRVLYRHPLSEKWAIHTVSGSTVKLTGFAPGVYEFAVQSGCAEGSPTNIQAFRVEGATNGQQHDNVLSSKEDSAGSVIDTSDFFITNTDYVVRQIETFPEIPKVVATASRTTTAANDGRIDVKVTDGHAPYQYSIDAKKFQNAPHFKKLKKGNYTVTVRDIKGVRATANVVIHGPND